MFFVGIEYLNFNTLYIMKTISFYKIPSHIEGLDFDGDKTDLRLHTSDNFRWAVRNKKGYKAIEKQINEFNIQGNGWIVYTWHDISGYDYWMKQREENNYIQITVRFDKARINFEEVERIDSAIYKAEQFAQAIQNKSNLF